MTPPTSSHLKLTIISVFTAFCLIGFVGCSYSTANPDDGIIHAPGKYKSKDGLWTVTINDDRTESIVTHKESHIITALPTAIIREFDNKERRKTSIFIDSSNRVWVFYGDHYWILEDTTDNLTIYNLNTWKKDIPDTVRDYANSADFGKE